MAAAATAGLLSRLTNVRNVRNIGNRANITQSFSLKSTFVTRRYSVDVNSILSDEDERKPNKKLSKAMRAYLERAKEYDDFIKKEINKYEMGKRHLANMMGENVENFTQKDVNRSIKYLFPSGLYERKARPIMESPEKLFPPRKEAEFDASGKPHHPFFYTCRPNYYQLLHNIVSHIRDLNKFEDQSIMIGLTPYPDEKINIPSSTWLVKSDLEKKLFENISDEDYDKFIAAGDRLIEHPYAFKVKDFIMDYRKINIVHSDKIKVSDFQYTAEGRPYIKVKDCKRKSARATVTVLGKGEGKITINGQDIRYFSNQQSREQVIFPLIFTGMDTQVDVEATVEHGGFTGQAGAIRFGISWALRSFVDRETIEKMRVAGLLTHDGRRKERKKPGQEGARRKFTWKKR